MQIPVAERSVQSQVTNQLRRWSVGQRGSPETTANLRPSHRTRHRYFIHSSHLNSYYLFYNQNWVINNYPISQPTTILLPTVLGFSMMPLAKMVTLIMSCFWWAMILTRVAFLIGCWRILGVREQNPQTVKSRATFRDLFPLLQVVILL
jgi:hypothetical protein